MHGYSQGAGRGGSGYSRPPRREPMCRAVTEPTPCDATVNLYRYTGQPTVLHSYAVTMEPEVHRNDNFARFVEIAAEKGFEEVYAYDGAGLLVSPTKFGDVELVSERRGDQRVRICYKQSCSIGEPEVDYGRLIQCGEVVTRHHQRLEHYVDRGRMIDPAARAYGLGGGLEVLGGLVGALKVTREYGLCMNLDMAYGVFLRPVALLELVSDLQEQRGRGGRLSDGALPPAGDPFYSKFERLIKNVRLSTTHREKAMTFRAFGLSSKAAPSTEFEVEGVSVSVAEYFAKTYGPLRHPELPLVVIKKRDRVLYMPMEVCRVAPMQRYIRKLDEAATAAMIKIAAQRPAERFALIAEKAKELAALKSPAMQRFGMAFDSRMLNCKGVLLPPPAITFSNDKKVFVNNGSWNLAGVEAKRGVVIDAWRIFTFRSNCRVAPAVLRSFSTAAARYGIAIPSDPETIVVQSVSDFFDAPKARFNLVVLPDKNAQRYEEIKRIAETYHSCYTQCIVASNLSKLSNLSFMSNLFLKINTKLGGCNWALNAAVFADKPTILFGIDVSHPGVGDLDDPSIVGVVASMDYNFATYRTSITQQERRQEIITDLRSTARAMLKAHYASTKTKPERIVIFRDGVGDSMFDAVFSAEVEALRGACTDLSPAYTPEFTFIVAQKRHSIRFAVNNANPVPGTVIDSLRIPAATTNSTCPVSFAACVHDFYMVSHHALQGTAHPVRYLVLLNESNFSASYIQQAVYGLCHLYMRATKSVSIVPPIYYAHLAAARGRCYLERNEEGIVSMRDCDKNITKTLYYL